MISDEQIEAALRTAWPDVELDDARPLTGGQWATMFHLHLAATPDGIPRDLVLRVVPHAEMGAKELAVQTAAAEAGIPTPRVHLTGPAGGPLTGAWAVMDLAPGDPLLADLDGVAALRRLPQILRRVPGQLADALAAIHRVDPAPVIERVRAAAPAAAFQIDQLCTHLRTGAAETRRRDLADAVDRLTSTHTAPTGTVACHWDMHPFTLLADGPLIAVLDWTGAIVAVPAYDVSLTWLLLRHPPLAAPSALRPAVSAGAGVLARRFLHRYRRANPAADLTSLDWYTSLHAARILIDLATWQRNDDPRAHTHPWHLIAPGAVRVLHRATRIEINNQR